MHRLRSVLLAHSYIYHVRSLNDIQSREVRQEVFYASSVCTAALLWNIQGVHSCVTLWMRFNNGWKKKKTQLWSVTKTVQHGEPRDASSRQSAGELRAWCRRSWCRCRCSWTTCWGSPSRCLLSEGRQTNTHSETFLTNRNAGHRDFCISVYIFLSGYLSWWETGRTWTFRWAGRGWRPRSRPLWTCSDFAQTCGGTHAQSAKQCKFQESAAAVVLLSPEWRSPLFSHHCPSSPCFTSCTLSPLFTASSWPPPVSKSAFTVYLPAHCKRKERNK